MALGDKIAGLMGNNEAWVAQVQGAAERAGERLWHLPLPDDYRRNLDSDVADIRNIASAGGAGTLVAGLFLKDFVDGKPWAHLDIAGTARSSSDDAETTKGATGYGVRTLVELASSFRRPAR
jgi:leucyl aminopeptidase